MANEVASIGQWRSGQLLLGAKQYSIAYLLPGVCRSLAREAPKASLNIIAGGNDVLVPAVQGGRLDLIIGFIPAAPDGLVDEQLLQDEFVVYASARHRLGESKRVKIADVAHDRWVLGPPYVRDWQWLHRAFESAGLAPPLVNLETSATPLRLHAVASSELLGFAPRKFVRQAAAELGLVELPIEELRWACRLAVRFRKDAYLTPLARRVIELLKAESRKSP